MATQQLQLVCDSSTVANFKQWASAISAWFSACGWTQTSDTGQVNWSTIASVPGSGAYVYEIWQPGDALTTFYVKMEYGNYSGSSNSPSLRISIGTGSNGSGTLTGYVLGPNYTAGNTITPPSSSTQYECDFSGANNRMGIMLWRNGTNNCQQSFCIERSVNSSGTYTSSHVTLVTVGYDGGPNYFGQQTLLFGVGVGPASNNVGSRGGSAIGGLIVRQLQQNSGASSAFNGTVGLDTIAPYIGYYDYPITCCGAAQSTDFVEGVTFTCTVYGSTRTYIPSKNSIFSHALANNYGNSAYCMRYD